MLPAARGVMRPGRASMRASMSSWIVPGISTVSGSPTSDHSPSVCTTTPSSTRDSAISSANAGLPSARVASLMASSGEIPPGSSACSSDAMRSFDSGDNRSRVTHDGPTNAIASTGAAPGRDASTTITRAVPTRRMSSTARSTEAWSAHSKRSTRIATGRSFAACAETAARVRRPGRAARPCRHQ